jgi:surface protein
VADMSFMFNGASSLIDLNAISDWDTGSVTNMSDMFRYASSLTDVSALSNWDIRAVIATEGSASNDTNNFYQMFNNVSSHPIFTKRLGTWNSDGTFVPSGETAVSVTVDLDSHVSSVSFQDATYGNRTVYEDGDFIVLASGSSYTITANIEEGYELSAWSATTGTLGSASTNPTTFTSTSDSTLTVTSAAVQNNQQNNQQQTPQNSPQQSIPQNIPANIQPSLSPQSLEANNIQSGDGLSGDTTDDGEITYAEPQGVSVKENNMTSSSNDILPAIGTAAMLGAGVSLVAYYVYSKKEDDEEDEQ